MAAAEVLVVEEASVEEVEVIEEGEAVDEVRYICFTCILLDNSVPAQVSK